MSSRSGAPSLAQKGRDASAQSSQLPTPIPSTHYGGGGVAKGVSSLQSSALSRRLSECMWATQVQNLGSPSPSARNNPMQVLVLVQYQNRYNAVDAELLVEARVVLDA